MSFAKYADFEQYFWNGTIRRSLTLRLFSHISLVINMTLSLFFLCIQTQSSRTSSTQIIIHLLNLTFPHRYACPLFIFYFTIFTVSSAIRNKGQLIVPASQPTFNYKRNVLSFHRIQSWRVPAIINIATTKEYYPRLHKTWYRFQGDQPQNIFCRDLHRLALTAGSIHVQNALQIIRYSISDARWF